MTIDPGSGPYGPKTMAENAAEYLHRAIVSGEVPAGSHLRLTEIAERLDMSMMPVREAVRRLESLGLVEVHPHRGAFVRELSKSDFEDTMATRVMLESAAVQQAAERFHPDHEQEAMYWLKRYTALVEADLVVEAREAHTSLHFTLYKASGSRWLVHAIEPVWRNSERYRFASQEHEPGESLHGEHEPIIRACVEHDPERAGNALTRHLGKAAERMAANIPEPEEGSE